MPPPRRLHPAWIVLGALTLCMLASTGVRAVFGVYIKPIEDEMHWSRGALSTAAAVSLLLLGAAGPFAGRLADRWGPARVIVLALTLLGVGSIASGFVTKLWHLFVTAGVVIGVGPGGAGPSTGAAHVARRVCNQPRPGLGLAARRVSAGARPHVPLCPPLPLPHTSR